MRTIFKHPSFQGLVGIARVDITPPVGVYSRCWGAAKHDVAESVHRPLQLSVLTLSQQGKDPLIFVDADLGWWKTPSVASKFLGKLKEELGIRPENLVFALTHTHSGPPLMDTDESLPGSDILSTWMETLYTKTVSTIREAVDSQFPGTLDWDTGRCKLASVRDLPDPDPGQGRILCGYNPEPEADDTLLLGRVSDETGAIRATLVNYACHPTTLAWENTAISPDYIGAMRETIEEATGAPSFFALGACGELAPRVQYVGDPEVADRHGRQLGFAALATLNGMDPPGTQSEFDSAVESGAPLAVWKQHPFEPSRQLGAQCTTVELALKDWPTAEELEQQRLACKDRAMEERLRRKRDIRIGLGNSNSYELEVYLWRIGDTLLLGTCCEPYSLLQTELRKRFPGETIVCMNLINGSLGYLPPAHLYGQDIYPVWQTPFAKGCLEQLIDHCHQLILESNV